MTSRTCCVATSCRVAALRRRGGAAARGGAPRSDGTTASADSTGEVGPSDTVVPFTALHQAGHRHAGPGPHGLRRLRHRLAADVDAVKAVLGTWAAPRRRDHGQGLPIGAIEHHPERPPIDTGEAFGLTAGNLTITVGFGPSSSTNVSGCSGGGPSCCRDLPTFRNDVIKPEISGGDLCVQACSDDPQVAFHVIRNFARIGRGVVTLRWSQLGFGRTSSTSIAQDDAAQPDGVQGRHQRHQGRDAADIDRFVWVGDDADQPWLAGGSYLIARRIRMLIESWDNTSLAEQERVIGRNQAPAAPRSAACESSTPSTSTPPTPTATR